jgi:hypothetical protein
LLPPGRLDPRWWIGITAILLGIDYTTGLYSVLPAVYVIPVALAAWYSGLWTALALAVVTPVAHAGFVIAGGGGTMPSPQLVGLTVIRGAVILVLAFWFARLSEHERELQRQVKTLEGLLSICAFCKSIRNERGEWERLEKVLTERSEARLSHAFCPECIKTHYPEMTSAGSEQTES